MDVKLINTGLVKPKYTKNVINYFCAAVWYESGKNIDKLIEARNIVENKVISTSGRYASENTPKPVYTSDCMIDCLFNQKNKIPIYILYWLNCCYYDYLGKAIDYTEKHTEIYNILFKEYVRCNRWTKEDDKFNKQLIKENRRKICKMFRSGKYSGLFKLYNTSVLDTVSEQEFDIIATLISNLFPKELSVCHDDAYVAAFGYILGKRGAVIPYM